MKNFLEFAFPAGDVMYPNPAGTGELLPLGELWTYIAMPLLSALLPYTRIRCGRLITRYRPHADNLAAVATLHQQLQLPERGRTRTDITQLPDDVVLLAQDRKTKSCWWYFYFDRDCSDCQVGRFKADVSDEQLMQSFADYADEQSRELSVGYGAETPAPAIELHIAAFRRF